MHNPFNEYLIQRTALFEPNFLSNNIRKVPFRSIGLNFIGKLGKREYKKEEESAAVNVPNE